MTKFTIIESSEPEYECPNPSEPSTILFEVETVSRTEMSVWLTLGEVDGRGGAFEYEQEFGPGIEYVIEQFPEVTDEVVEGGWYIIEGFTCHFTKDYWGEVDCDHEFTHFRIATDEDKEAFYSQ